MSTSGCNYIEKLSGNINYDIIGAIAILNQYGCELTELINLCGGLPVEDTANIYCVVIRESETAIVVNITTEHYTVRHKIDFSLGVIYTRDIDVIKPGNGIGKKLFINQFHAASARKFKRIIGYAQDTVDTIHYEGYVFWAKIGFMMVEDFEIKLFEELLADYKPGWTLGQLVLHPKGCTFWRKKGFGWQAEFDLEKESNSIQQLKKYLQLKKLEHWLDHP